MNTTLHSPAKVAPVKASHLMQDENSGKDGRRFNEWLANRPDSRRRAREAAEAIVDAKSPDQPIKTKVDLAVALTVWAVAPILAAGVGLLIAEIVNYVRS